ncbi:sterol desaturase family protein [Novosphingobium sp. MBES04]|uniref:sterol desaturase family protein n=1 Tax=Novosphingobium sp. MBES04 TaxID=1206458 RepID=UPI000A074CA8|nr:sterol desaturase family protein [Novosphingobium sp. MBES04]
MARTPTFSPDYHEEHEPVSSNASAVGIDFAPAPRAAGLKALFVDLLPPFTVLAVVLFWMFAPASLTQSPWSLVVAGLAVTTFVQLLEWAFERHEGWRMNGREFATDVFYVALGYTAIGWLVEVAGDGPLFALKETLGIATPWAGELPFLVQVVMVMVLFEFGQYWMHRLMHNSTPFWLTHAPHHHVTQLNAMKGYVGNPIELFLIGLSVLAFFDFDMVPVFCAFNVLGVVSTYAHANVRANPPAFYAFFFTTIRHHSLHHSTDYESTRCNYANSLILLDRLMGTYREGEARVVGQDDLRRLTIREQFLFPFQPVIDRLRSTTKTTKASTGQP